MVDVCMPGWTFCSAGSLCYQSKLDAKCDITAQPIVFTKCFLFLSVYNRIPNKKPRPVSYNFLPSRLIWDNLDGNAKGGGSAQQAENANSLSRFLQSSPLLCVLGQC